MESYAAVAHYIKWIIRQEHSGACGMLNFCFLATSAVLVEVESPIDRSQILSFADVITLMARIRAGSGHSFVVEGRTGWQLTIQHNDGSGVGRLVDSPSRSDGRRFRPLDDGVRRQAASRSRRTGNDLVLRVETDGPILDIPVRPTRSSRVPCR